MGNLEKYGVLALIFVIVLILTVAIWNGPSDATKRAQQQQQVAQVDPNKNNNSGGDQNRDPNQPQNQQNGQANNNPQPANNLGMSEEDLRLHPALAEQLRKQQEEEARLAAAKGNNNNTTVVPGGAPPANHEAAGGVEKNPNFKKYKIGKGDTLQSIAGKQLGSKNRWQEILKANEGLNPTRLKIGVEILIPGGETLASADGKSEVTAASKKDTKENRLAKSSR